MSAQNNSTDVLNCQIKIRANVRGVFVDAPVAQSGDRPQRIVELSTRNPATLRPKWRNLVTFVIHWQRPRIKG